MAPVGHAFTHSAQKMHLPRSSATGLPGVFSIALVGQTGKQAEHSSTHLDASTFNAPPCRSGNGGAEPLGYAIVSQPRFSRWTILSNTNISDHKSKPQYERLKLLLHNGKSDMAWLRRASVIPVQLW